MKRVSLFTSSSKKKEHGICSPKHKKYFDRVLGALCFLCLFFGIEKIMEYALVNDANEWSRAMFHDFYTREENIDTLFLGSSHVYCGINPAIIEEATGESAFNMATPAQPLNGSYYLLKEADKYNDISHVYLELYFGQSTGEEGHFKKADQLPRNWRNTNYMKPSLNKLSYMLTMSEPSLTYMTFLPTRRYWTDSFEPEKIKETIQQKRTEAYADYYVENVLNGVVETYAEDGFYYSEHKAEGGVLYDVIMPEPFSENPMTEEAESYLRKIIEYCEKEQIELTLYSAPVTDYQASLYGEYDRYVEQVESIAAEYGLSYYDFNLCKEEYLDLTDDGLFRDKGHLNIWGAEIFSEFLADFFNGLEEGSLSQEQCFYPSYAEKIENGKERILGIVVEKEESGEENSCYKITPIHNLKDKKVEYYIYTMDENGNKHVICDRVAALTESVIVVPTREYVTLYIEAKPEGKTETTNFVQINE